MTPKYPIKLVGHLTWLYPGEQRFDRFKVQRALFRSPDEFVIDCDCGAPQHSYVYTMKLSRVGPDQFSGTFSVCHTTDPTSGTVSFRVYRRDGGIALSGNWIEKGYHDEILGELTVVDRFPDERSD
ncbi:MAG: hypothetical protein FJ398_10490 [Verrucomicrobia bacterium]|nr:hypothetical protein [Verrucomicrobiota bacterium]